MIETQPAGLLIDHVSKDLGGRTIVSDMQLEVHAGELTCLLGPSGCGKTTTLRMIGGFLQPDGGEILIDGSDVSRLPPERRPTAMVFQNYALWPHMTVFNNVAFGLKLRKLPKNEIRERVENVLELVGLTHHVHSYPARISGGEQQRVALARALVLEPKVLLLDEPLSNLDARLRVEMRSELRQLQRKLGITAIYVTHDQEEANAVCDRIAVMNERVVQQVGTPVELYERPANLFVASFLGTANILQGEIIEFGAERAYRVGELRLPIPASASVPPGARMVFRPQDARIGASGPDMAAVPGNVASREFLGATMRYVIRIGEAEVIVDTPFHTGDAVHEIEARVTVGVPVRSVLWLSA
jgi:iron(III) transport system ATP-binding protein